MSLPISMLRPGSVIVTLKTTIRGNANYHTRDIESEHITDDGSLRGVREVTKTIEDPQEFEEAVKTRAKCRSLITGVCTKGNFLLCAENDLGRLETAIEEAQDLAREFNRRARLSRIEIYAFPTQVSSDDTKTIRAIRSEVRDLISDMEDGFRTLDTKLIREAASKAKTLGSILEPEMTARVEKAIEVARYAAKKIVKAGEQGARQVDEYTKKNLAQSRMSFLDFDDENETREIRTPVTSGRALDLPLDTRTMDEKLAALI